MQYLLVGNYGVGNLGDEALKDFFLTSFPDVQWKVVSAHPQQHELPRFPGGLRSFLSGDWKQTVSALRQMDGIVFGGGTLFTDIESIHACFIWWIHTKFARAHKKPYHCAFQGVGPFKTRIGEWFARDAIRHAASVSVRDESSYLRIQQWNPSAHIVQTFDPIFSLVDKNARESSSKKILIVIPRNNSNQPFRERAFELLQKHSEWDEVHVLSMQPDDQQEKTLCEELRTCSGIPTYIFQLHTLQELIDAVSKGDFVLSQRYHGALVALALGIPLEVSPQGALDKLSSIQAIIASNDVQSQIADSLRSSITNGSNALLNALKKDGEPSVI